MESGTVVRKTERGYGFIKRDNGEKDIFFHSNELKNVQFEELEEGVTQVTFDVAEGPKGLNATNVNRK
jgi:CspA family cold shock protein